MKQSGCKVEDWMLQLRKSSKKKPPRRQNIDTTPSYDKRKRHKKKHIIEQSKKKKKGSKATMIDSEEDSHINLNENNCSSKVIGETFLCLIQGCLKERILL